MKNELVRLLQAWDSEMDRFLAALPPEKQEADGTFEHWSAKDTLGHITAWNEIWLQRLDALRGNAAAPSLSDDEEENNLRLYRERETQTLAQAAALAQQARARLIQETRNFSEEDLLSIYPIGNSPGSLLWRTIVSDGFLHPISHLNLFLVQNEQKEAALDLQDRFMPMLMGLTDDQDWQATVMYDQACFYALAGEKEKALQALRASLPLSPSLVEWS